MSESRPKVSVIMNCLNGERYLREAIDSVYKQTFNDWEIVFFDNASTDNTLAIAKNYDKRLKYFKGECTVSLGLARNFAFCQCRGEYIAFLDVDDSWMPNKLQKQTAILDEDPKIGIVYSNAVYFSGTNRNNGYRLYAKVRPASGMIFSDILRKYDLCLSTVLVRRTAYDSLAEGFDDRFNVAEEADVFLRIAYGWKAQYIDEPLVYYRVHEQSVSSTRFDLFPKEMELILQKLKDRYPDLRVKYSNEIKDLTATIQYWYSMDDFKNGRKKDGRNRLVPHLFKRKRLLIPYLFSFLPFKLYVELLKLREALR